MATIGFLHTADLHVATYRELLAALGPDHDDVHVVDAALLESARTDGLTPALGRRVDDRIGELRAAGADLIVCTCSTLGGLAERGGEVPVMRGDRPMAEEAVAAGGPIAVLYATPSTLRPSVDLLVAAGADPTDVRAVDGTEAWPAFARGDLTAYREMVAHAARLAAPHAGVIVLAQPSMAPARDLLTDLPIGVLSSPRSAVTRAVALLSDVPGRPVTPG